MTPPASVLVDARTGIVRRLERRTIPDWFPPSFSLTHAVLADTAVFSRWPSDSSGAGYAFSDPDAELGAAIGEAVERYCGNLVGGEIVTASWDELVERGDRALDPGRLALFSASQHASGSVPVPPFLRSTAVDWMRADDLTNHRPILVPAGLVWVSHSLLAEPLLHPVIQAGLATGRSVQEARWSGLCEVVERDAMTLAWTGGGGMTELRVPLWLSRFAAGPRGALDTRWLAFASPTGVPVIGAVVADRVTGYLTLGMGVSAEPEAAAVKALGEALQLQLFVADYDDADGPYMSAAASPASPLKPWRADRAYAKSYADDLRDVIDYGCHLQLHLDPAVQRAFLDELESSITGVAELSTLADDDTPRTPAGLVEAFARAGLDVICADVTTTDVAPTGLSVLRMIVPGTYSNAPFALPFLGGARLPHPVRRPVPLPH